MYLSLGLKFFVFTLYFFLSLLTAYLSCLVFMSGFHVWHGFSAGSRVIKGGLEAFPRQREEVNVRSREGEITAFVRHDHHLVPFGQCGMYIVSFGIMYVFSCLHCW